MLTTQKLFIPLGTLMLMTLCATAAMAQQPLSEEAVSCSGCQLFEQSCTLNCSALESREEVTTCLLSCAEVAANCSCDEEVTLESEDMVTMGWAGERAGHKASCNATTPCPPEYSSCASWSSYSDCGSTYCGTYKFCGNPPSCHEPSLCWGPATTQKRERFRVCLNASGHTCTEYQQTSYPVSCGC